MSQIEATAKIYYDQTHYWDISPMITKVDIMYGRNQPFMYQCIEVNKLYFTSYEAYWKNNADANTPRNGQNILLPPNNIVDGQTKVELQAYGVGYTLLLERHESSDDVVSLVCYNSAYYLQSPGSLKQSATIHFNVSPYLYGIGPLHTTADRYQITDFVKVGNYYQFQYKNITFHTNVEDYESGKTYQVGDVVYRSTYNDFIVRTTNGWTYTGEIVPLYISGKGSDLFAYFSYIVAKYDVCVVDEGYTYDYGTSIKNTYTLSEINNIKNKSVVSSDGDFKLRVNNNYSCWEIIKSIGAQSNRWPFFYDKAYFVDYISDNTTRDTITQMDIDYGVDSDGLSKTRYTRTPEGSTPNYEYIDLYTIVKNADQGSEYVQTSQTVFQETYNATVSIGNATNTSEGYPLYFPYPESNPDDTSINNNDRNLTIRKIAFNRVVQNYKPSDAVQIQFSEVGSGNNIIAIGTYAKASDLPTTGIDVGAYALVMKDNIFQEYYRFNGSVWAKLDSYGDTTNGIYVQKFQPYTLVKSINDVQNGLNLTNVALACVELIWPSCITQITFGNPEFMDAQRQWKSLSLEAQISTIQGSEGSLLSDRYASKLVIGNQNMSDLQDDRKGFTGLIMEKNYDNELYRLSGYNNGVLQAYFNSQGEIMSGSGNVILNNGGIYIGAGSTIDPSLLPDSGISVWDDNQNYVVNDIVQWKGILYSCIADNSGKEPGTADGNGYWESSGDLSLWDTTKTYEAGDYVLYNGAVYKCLIATGNTNVPQIGSSTSYWEILNETATGNLDGDIDAQNNNIYSGSIQVWQSGVRYTRGTIVYNSQDGITYEAKYTHTSTQTFNPLYWTQISAEEDKKGKTIIDAYGLTTYNSDGNAVCRVGTDGRIYGIKVKAQNIEAGTMQADVVYAGTLDASQITTGTLGQGVVYAGTLDATQITSGTIDQARIDTSSLVVSGTVSPWKQNTLYRVNDMVTYNNYLYKCTVEHTSDTSFSSTNWDAQNQSYSTTSGTAGTASTSYTVSSWSSTTTYSAGRMVKRDNIIYVSKQSNNRGNDPATDTTQQYWESFSQSQGSGSVKITPAGLSTWDGSVKVAEVGSDGVFKTGFDTNGTQHVTLGSGGLVINTDSDFSSSSVINLNYTGTTYGYIGGYTWSKPSGSGTITQHGIRIQGDSLSIYSGEKYSQQVGTQQQYYYQYAPVIRWTNSSTSKSTYGFIDYCAGMYRSGQFQRRNYISGYMELSGRVNSVSYDVDININFTQPGTNDMACVFSDSNYNVSLTFENSSSDDEVIAYVVQRYTTYMTVHIRRVESHSQGTRNLLWKVSGQGSDPFYY